MTYRDAKSLLTLRDQIDAAWPNRSKASDGMLGDKIHIAEGSASDHNPWLLDSSGIGVVRALDITHDPAHGCDTYALADRLRLATDHRLANGGYIISDHRITGPQHGWEWVAYNGADPHTGHMHVSVSKTQLLYDDTSAWAGVEEDTMTPAEFALILKDPQVAAQMRALPWQYDGRGIPEGLTTLGVLNGIYSAATADNAAKIAAAVVASLPPEVADQVSLADIQPTVHTELGKLSLTQSD